MKLMNVTHINASDRQNLTVDRFDLIVSASKPKK